MPTLEIAIRRLNRFACAVRFVVCPHRAVLPVAFCTGDFRGAMAWTDNDVCLWNTNRWCMGYLRL